jgi:hypothetical protein
MVYTIWRAGEAARKDSIALLALLPAVTWLRRATVQRQGRKVRVVLAAEQASAKTVRVQRKAQRVEARRPAHACVAIGVHATTERVHAATERVHATTEREHATTEREHATTEREHATTERGHVTTEREYVTTEREHVTTEREHATTERVHATTEREYVTTEREHVTTEREHATTERVHATTERVHATTKRLPCSGTGKPDPPGQPGTNSEVHLTESDAPD